MLCVKANRPTEYLPSKFVIQDIDTWVIAISDSEHDYEPLAATGGFNCRAYIFPKPQKGPCYLCILIMKDYEEISRIFSCTRRGVNEAPAPP